MLKNFLLFTLLSIFAFVSASCVSHDNTAAGTPQDLAPTTDSEPFAVFMEAGKYSDALELALREKIFGVANYLAEYVFETDELYAFVRKNYPEAPTSTPTAENADGTIIESTEDAANEVRYTLARRLLREGKPQQSREFFPKELLPVFDRYVEEIQRGYNFDLSDAERARGFWEAAMIVRENGDALFSVFSVPAYVMEKEFYTEDERARVNSRDKTEPWISLRLRAATLAQYASELLPNNDERTARILFTAGVWLRARDAEAADGFYKSLVIRCPKTEVGKRCIELRWFPTEVPWTRSQVWDGIPVKKSAEPAPEENGANADPAVPANAEA